jgi:exosome complex component RRP45
MPRDLEPSLNNRTFTLTALQNGLRIDGRRLTHPRELSLSFGDTPGTAYVQLGKTKSLPPPARHPPLTPDS